ncbi:FecR domain-containing protein [Chitinophaga sp. MM2321]|uniref:FecR family protein n=1 Tax=Chitinophaga sp. MM2321 TaxID=3137178 RepID=UPI0032D5AB92
MDDLIACFLSGNTTLEEQKILEDWISADAGNRIYFLQLRDAWLAAAQPGQYDAVAGWNEVLRQGAIAPMKPVAGWKRYLRIAASFTLPFMIGGGVVFAWFSLGKQADSQGMVTVTSPKGATTKIALADGTEVWLNAGSKLQYASSYNTQRREVKLEGEAFFKVHTNPQKPFTVNAADLQILALGTSFNVKAYPEDKTVVTTLVEGEVKIDGSKTASPFRMMLKPRQHVVYKKPVADKKNEPVKVSAQDPGNKPVESKEVNDTEIYTAWKDGNWIVTAQTMEELAITMQRRFNVKVIFKDEELKTYRFSGTFRQETLEQVLNILKLTAPLRYTIDSGVVTVELDKVLKEKYANALRTGK